VKILILTYTNPFNASGIVAYDLLIGLSSIEGNDVRILVREWDKYEDNRIVTIETAFEHYLYAIIRRIKLFRKKTLKFIFKNYKTKDEKLKDKINSDYYFEYDMSETVYSAKKILKRAGFKPDIIFVLFMKGFVSFKNLYEISKISGGHILLYLMDMAPLTGGCHYAWDCTGYHNKCGNCPALYSNQEKDRSRINWEFKRRYIQQTDLSVIYGCNWHYRQLLNCKLFNQNKKFKIPLSINTEIFKPGNRDLARANFNLSKEKKIIFFGAIMIKDKRKGFIELMETLMCLKNNLSNSEINHIHVIIAGHDAPELTSKLPFPYTILGYLNHKTLASAFHAADIFVSPTIEDSGPMIIIQSLLCGIPVASFDIGVAQDLVINGQTGYKAALKDCEGLAKGIQSILELDEVSYKEVRSKCAKLSIEMFHKNIFFECLKFAFGEVVKKN
jgi:glycosyltransferase involved in cell wall biosynthesis